MKNGIGVITSLRPGKPCFGELKSLRIKVCQLSSWSPELWTEALARRVKKEAAAEKVRVTAFWAGWRGPKAWNFVDGPATLGLVPAAYRDRRAEDLIRAGVFAQKAGLSAVITHLGFIPEDPSAPDFKGVVVAVREIALRYMKLGLEFWFETGQETPVTMLRLIQHVGAHNLGLNLDPANLVVYGKANPIDALDVFGSYVRNVHAKDGLYPTNPMELGAEVKVGRGRVRFPELVGKLKEMGFSGEFIIERELSGAQQRKDIKDTIVYLRRLLDRT